MCFRIHAHDAPWLTLVVALVACGGTETGGMTSGPSDPNDHSASGGTGGGGGGSGGGDVSASGGSGGRRRLRERRLCG